MNRAKLSENRRRVTVHELAIRQLINNDRSIKRYGFPDAVRGIVEEFGCDRDCLVNRRFLPDAYRIDRQNWTIDLFEVEDTCKLSPRKLETLARWWEAWDGEGQTEFYPRLFTVDRYGRTTGEVDLMAVLWAL